MRVDTTGKVRAVVCSIEEASIPYAVCKADGFEGTITFALTKNVWENEKHPTRGEAVWLSELQKTKRGWRALKAEY